MPSPSVPHALDLSSQLPPLSTTCQLMGNNHRENRGTHFSQLLLMMLSGHLPCDCQSISLQTPEYIEIVSYFNDFLFCLKTAMFSFVTLHCSHLYTVQNQCIKRLQNVSTLTHFLTPPDALASRFDTLWCPNSKSWRFSGSFDTLFVTWFLASHSPKNSSPVNQT